MSNLLLITDVARLRKIFGRLTDDKNIRLRVVTNLEKGGEEIALEKPDVVFVQTHLSGLSADILLMHLKKQLGRKRSRFILLAAPGQINDTILRPYQGWLDTSADDSELLPKLQQLLGKLLNKPDKSTATGSAEPIAPADFTPQPVSSAEYSALLERSPVSDAVPPKEISTELQLALSVPVTAEPSLEEQGITYAPRQRLKVYSEFNSSFDSAVSSTPDPESLEQATPSVSHDWNAESIDTVAAKSTRSKRGIFLLWLAPVIVAVVVITYLQQQRPPHKTEPAADKSAPAVKTAAPVLSPAASVAIPPKAANVATQAAPLDQDKMSDKAVLSAIAENRTQKSPAPTAPSAARPTSLPDFIPRYGIDKTFSAANPGWERYRGEVTEFKVLREAGAIKVIQVIDRGGQGVPESFLKAVLRQVAKNPAFSALTSEKKEGYEIQRGSIAANIKVVYYRDEQGGKLRAFVLTWQ